MRKPFKLGGGGGRQWMDCHNKKLIDMHMAPLAALGFV